MSAAKIHIENSFIKQFSDQLGTQDTNIELIRFDDCWRPLVDAPASLDGFGCMEWKDHWGSHNPYGHEPAQHVRPLDFDVWGDPNTLRMHNPINFKARLHVTPAEFNDIEGLHFNIEVTDLRTAEHPLQHILKIPVGFRIPLQGNPEAFGIREMYLDPELIQQRVKDPHFCHEWFYLEAELFSTIQRNPMDGLGPQRRAWQKRVHAGAPMACFRPEGQKAWWALSGESDYGAAIHWREHDVLIFTTLYLKPGGKASWKSCLWRQEEENPANVMLSATSPGGFFDQMNPPGLERKGPPEGPVAFININRPEKQLEELRKVKPKLVILNYIYDHISSISNLYGEWTTYEGFHMTEEKLKALIAEIKAMGAKVGYYGTSVEQPESHAPLHQDDIVLDRWGRRFNAWEPGNWVIDAGNRNCAERLAKTEAEFAQYYGMDCVFVDRLDHLSVNAHPQRQGCPGNDRLECIPSVRLGLIELMKQRVKWQRKLNPDLLIALNNTTQWAGGVRYSDFNLLEGGMDLDPPIFFLNAPHGIIHLQHYNVLFSDYEQDIVDHGIVQDEEQLKGFQTKRLAFFRDALADGVLALPYEDEIFVSPQSSFFKGWNNRELPDDEKWAFFDQLSYYGGAEWHNDHQQIAKALEVAHNTFPITKVWTTPESLPENIRFSARQGQSGALFIGLRNLSETDITIDIQIATRHIQGQIPAGQTRAWFACTRCTELETVLL